MMTGITFPLGIGGSGIHSLEVQWTDQELIFEVMFAFIYRLYSPGKFVDEAYVKMQVELDKQSRTAISDIRIDAADGAGRPMECS